MNSKHMQNVADDIFESMRSSSNRDVGELMNSIWVVGSILMEKLEEMDKPPLVHVTDNRDAWEKGPPEMPREQMQALMDGMQDRIRQLEDELADVMGIKQKSEEY
jgi:hypothetical protein